MSLPLPATSHYGHASLRRQKDNSSHRVWLFVYVLAPNKPEHSIEDAMNEGHIRASIRFLDPNGKEARKAARDKKRMQKSISSALGTPALGKQQDLLASTMKRLVFEPGPIGINLVGETG